MSVWVLLLLLAVAADTGLCHDLAEEVGKLIKRLETVEKENAKLKTGLTRFCSFLTEFLEPEQEQLLRNCLEAKQTHPHSGIQTIQVATHSIPVFCDQTTDGGGWTLIQRRRDGSVDFYRDWVQYENGFGNLSGEFWLGLRNIHEMTTSGNYSLRVDLWDKSGAYVYALYSSFYIDGPTDKYRLHLGGYSGTAGDSMVNISNGNGVANNMAFSTYDRDNDLTSGSCAPGSHGAWWYNSCQHSNLNGQYYADGSDHFNGIRWYRYKIDDRSFTKTELKIKPVNN